MTGPVRLTDRQRARLVDALREKGIAHEGVLAAIGRIPRHEFIPELGDRPEAYKDVAVPIGLGQTISQPFTVATMTELLDVQPGERVLEVGTGSGYQAAVLAELGARVFSVERHRPLLLQTRPVLERLGYRIRTRHGDGMEGWSALAPFDAIIVTAAGPEVPPALVAQLRAPSAPGAPEASGEGRPGGRMVTPVALEDGSQQLLRIRRTGPGPDDVETERLAKVRFVPLLPGAPGR